MTHVIGGYSKGTDSIFPLVNARSCYCEEKNFIQVRCSFDIFLLDGKPLIYPSPTKIIPEKTRHIPGFDRYSRRRCDDPSAMEMVRGTLSG